MADIEPNEELANLLKAVSEDRLSPQQHEKLEAILRDDPEARKHYLRYVHADALLSWRYAPVPDQPATLDAGDEAPGTLAALPDRREEAGNPVTFKPTTSGHRDSRVWWVSGIGVALAASLVLAALLSRSTHAVTVLKGEAVCTACVLHEGQEHAPALRVIDGANTTIYYLDRTPALAALQGYFCSGPTAATAEGEARTEEGRRLFQAATITIPEANASVAFAQPKLAEPDASELLPPVASAQAVDDKVPAKNTLPFDTVGLYVSLPTDLPPTDEKFYDFLAACGYNYLEFCEAGFRSRPDLLPDYYQQMSRAVDIAHQKGFRVGIVLLAGVEQWKGPEKTGFAGAFSPLDKTRIQERLTHLRHEVQQLRSADRFVFFPGDPGGDPKGRSTVEDCLEFARQVRQIVKEEAPRAEFMMNLWAIAEWEGFPTPMGLRFWQQEVKLSRAAAAAPDLLGPDCGVAFPLHNYYRSLALACYAEAGIAPEPYPTEKDIQTLRARGVKPLLGWPYFLVDEADEGFIRPNNVASGGQSSAETRYIRALVDRGRALGLDGLVANAIFVKDEPLNIYAFGQMCRSPDLTPEQLIDRYAGLVADGETQVVLGRVLRYIENYSNWQASLPPSSRLKNFDVQDVASASVALDLLAQVRPCIHPAIPLPEPPALYLQRLKKRLEAIAAGNIGSVNRIKPSK